MSLSPKTYKVAVPANTGAYAPIVPKTWARRIEIIEDDAASQGLTYQLPDDNFVTTYTVTDAHEPIVLGSGPNQPYGGRLIGYPQQKDAFGNNTGGATVIQVRSNSATATNVIVREYP